MTDDPGRGVERVLYVTAWMDVGGSEKFALDALDQLRRRGVAIAMVTTVESAHRWRVNFEERVDALLDLTTVAITRRAGAFVRFARGFDPDVIVVSNSRYLYELIPYVHRCLPGVRIVDYCHAEQPEWRGGGYPQMSIRQQRWLSRTLCASGHLRDWMVARGANADRCDIVRCNVDVDYWDRRHLDRARARECLGLPAAGSVIAVVARLDENKRPLVAFDAIARAAGASPVTALFVGSGPLEKTLRTRAAAKPGVRLEIRAGGSETVRAAYAAGDVLLLPSSAEGISLAVYEAMSMGLPVVASDVGGHAELVTPGTGVLVPLSGNTIIDTDRFAAVLGSMMASDEGRAQLSSAARQRVVEVFSLPAMGDALFASLQLADLRPPAGPWPAAFAWLRTAASLVGQAGRHVLAESVRWALRRPRSR